MGSPAPNSTVGSHDSAGRALRFLLIGPFDPQCGEYTFISPPLGVWRLAGHLEAHGIEAVVFDPNLCEGAATERLTEVLADGPWDVVGVSTTAMTLRFDLQLAHHTRAVLPRVVLVAGGMEATFNPERTLELAPFDIAVLGEGEQPLLVLAERLRSGAEWAGIPGTAMRAAGGGIVRFKQMALTQSQLREAIFRTPYEHMPYPAYWRRLEQSCRVGSLPFKADREARLAEIRSVRLITLNYCPMACSFCSSTNFLHSAQGSVARLARLDAQECLAMILRIMAALPQTRTIIFQDDIFVFTQDQRILPLCDAIVAAKERGELPRHLQFISTNRIDSMTSERLSALRRAGFRVLGFGIENFSRRVLSEFNKAQIYPHIEPTLREARRQGITPFMDLILTSPGCRLDDLTLTLNRAFYWLTQGCEVGIYPYVIPFTGAALAQDAALHANTVYETLAVPGTNVHWRQASKLLPTDAVVRSVILCAEARMQSELIALSGAERHLPSRVRSLLWVACVADELRAIGQQVPASCDIQRSIARHLPAIAVEHPPREGDRAALEVAYEC